MIFSGVTAWWKTASLDKPKHLGTVAAAVSAFGALIFGAASTITAFNVYELQIQARKDAFHSRISDRQILYLQRSMDHADDLTRGAACLGFAVDSQGRSDWLEILGEKGQFFTQDLLKKPKDKSKIEEFVWDERDRCVATDQLFPSKLQMRLGWRDLDINTVMVDKPATGLHSDRDGDLMIFQRRSMHILASISILLTEWRPDMDSELKNQIDNTILQDVCDSSVKLFMNIGRKDRKFYNLIINGTFDKLYEYSQQTCK